MTWSGTWRSYHFFRWTSLRLDPAVFPFRFLPIRAAQTIKNALSHFDASCLPARKQYASRTHTTGPMMSKIWVPSEPDKLSGKEYQ
jgi:hypothetical protein